MKTKILVIDDNQSNLNSAKNQFKNKNVELICCPLYSVAVDFIKTEKFDIVLTDLMLPGEPEGISSTNLEIGEEVPYGLVLSILAKNYGVKNVAIMTNISHHSGPIAWAMDQLFVQVDHNLVNAFSHKKYLEVAELFMEINDINEQQMATKPEKEILMIAGVNNDFKEELRKSLGDTLDIFIVQEELKGEIPKIFFERNPKYTLLIGEIHEKVDEYGKFSIVGEFNKLLKVKRSDQKILVAGWMPVENNPSYIRLPFTNKDLIEKLIN